MGKKLEVVFPVSGNVCITVEAGDVIAAIAAATPIFERLNLERDLSDDIPQNVWRSFAVTPDPVLDVSRDACMGPYVFDESGKVVSQ